MEISSKEMAEVLIRLTAVKIEPHEGAEEMFEKMREHVREAGELMERARTLVVNISTPTEPSAEAGAAIARGIEAAKAERETGHPDITAGRVMRVPANPRDGVPEPDPAADYTFTKTDLHQRVKNAGLAISHQFDMKLQEGKTPGCNHFSYIWLHLTGDEWRDEP